MLNSKDEESRNMARSIASRRVLNSYRMFKDTSGNMYEKYDARSAGDAGGGGEYEVQLGFGWTNGVVLDFMDMYSKEISTSKQESNML